MFEACVERLRVHYITFTMVILRQVPIVLPLKMAAIT